MAHELENPNELPQPEAVPKKFRTVVYFIALFVGFLSLLVVGFGHIFANATLADQLDQANGVVAQALLFLTGALGVAYRPTKGL